MSRILPSLLATLLIVLTLATQASAESRITTQDISVDHNVYRQNAKGMVIHVKFKADGLLRTNCRAVAYVFLADGQKLHGVGTTHVSRDRQVCSGGDFTPKYDHSNYGNFELFLPYSAFPFTQQGRYSLKFFVEFYVKADGTKLGRSAFHAFTYNRR